MVIIEYYEWSIIEYDLEFLSWYGSAVKYIGRNRGIVKGTCRKLDVPFTKLHMDQICLISNCHVSVKLFKS